MPDPIENWDKAKILELAKTTGKPLEVECALHFIASNARTNPTIPGPGGVVVPGPQLAPPWKVEFGSYYRDDMSDKMRELDILATRTMFVTRPCGQIHTFVKVAVSCKGFPDDFGPTTFALDASRVDATPSLLFGEADSNGFPGTFVSEAASTLLTAVGLRTSQGNNPMIIGYNVFEEQVKAGIKEYKRNKDREKDLFEHGMDSAVKASVFWWSLIFPTHVKAAGAFIPVLVVEKKWWQFPVDTGHATEPALQSRGFLVNSYPVKAGRLPLPLVSLMCTKDELGAVIAGLEEFADWFGNTASGFFRGGPR